MTRSKPDLNKISIGFSPLTGELYLYRYGRDPNVALEKREAHLDVIWAAIQYLMHDTPRGSSQDICANEQWYRVMVCPIDGPDSPTPSYQPELPRG